MIFISQDGLKAIDSREIQYYFITGQANCYQILVMPKNRDSGDKWNVLSLFRHKNLKVVKQVMRFISNYAINAKANAIVDVDIESLCELGMPEIDSN